MGAPPMPNIQELREQAIALHEKIVQLKLQAAPLERTMTNDSDLLKRMLAFQSLRLILEQIISTQNELINVNEALLTMLRSDNS
jgi:hypothetical protein